MSSSVGNPETPTTVTTTHNLRQSRCSSGELVCAICSKQGWASQSKVRVCFDCVMTTIAKFRRGDCLTPACCREAPCLFPCCSVHHRHHQHSRYLKHTDSISCFGRFVSLVFSLTSAGPPSAHALRCSHASMPLSRLR